jgi:hypothetical protein
MHDNNLNKSKAASSFLSLGPKFLKGPCQVHHSLHPSHFFLFIINPLPTAPWNGPCLYSNSSVQYPNGCHELCKSSLMTCRFNYNASPTMSDFHISSAPRALAIKMASSVYLVGLNITFLESDACVAFTFTGEHSPNVDPQIFCPLHVCAWLGFCPPCLLPRWGKRKNFLFERGSCDILTMTYKEIPREQARDKLLTVSMGKGWDQSLSIP